MRHYLNSNNDSLHFTFPKQQHNIMYNYLISRRAGTGGYRCCTGLIDDLHRAMFFVPKQAVKYQNISIGRDQSPSERAGVKCESIRFWIPLRSLHDYRRTRRESYCACLSCARDGREARSFSIPNTLSPPACLPCDAASHNIVTANSNISTWLPFSKSANVKIAFSSPENISLKAVPQTGS